ncbi:MAG TPA: hypothetical protein VF937_01665 [Chloroflexota bacterium]
MSTGEGADAGDEARDNRAEREDRNRRGEHIAIGGGDDSVTRIQLAARWAETYGPQADSLGGILRRFRAAYDYLDAVIHGVEPPDLDRELAESRSEPAAPAYASRPPAAAQAQASPPPPPPPEARPWS